MTTASRKPAFKPSIADKAEMLLANQAAWLRLRNAAGKIVGYGVPSMTVPGLYHRTNGKTCGCTAGREGRECSHRLAAALHIEDRRAEQAAPVTPIRPPKVLPGERIARAAQLARFESELFPDDVA